MIESRIHQLVRGRLGATEAVNVEMLGGGITNRNFRVDLDGAPRWVVRVFGESSAALGIDRAIELRSAARAAADGYGPRIAASWEDERMLVTEFLAGQSLTPETAGEPETLRRIAGLLRRHHASGDCGGRFLTREIVNDYLRKCRACGGSLPEEIDFAQELLHRIDEAVMPRVGRAGLVPCHNDLLPGNFLRAQSGNIALLDWEYAGMGDRFFDLGNLAVNLEFDETACDRLLGLYFGEFAEADRAHLHLLRICSDLREAMWGFLQQAISDLDEDFERYGRSHLERSLRNAADPRFESWLATVKEDS